MNLFLEGFEKFTMRGRSFKPKVTIRSRGQISFNNGCIQRYELDKYNYAVLFMSNDKNKIAIVMTNNQEEEGATKLIKKSGNFFLSGKSFLDYYGIDYEKSTQFDVEWMSEQKALVVELDNEESNEE